MCLFDFKTMLITFYCLFLHANKQYKNEAVHFFKTFLPFLFDSWRPFQSRALTIVSMNEWELVAK